MKTAGIVTIHMINNYGAVEQAYALNKFLRNNGIDAKTIDFRTYRVAESYEIYHHIYSPMDLIRNGQSAIFHSDLKKRNKRFSDFISEHLPLTDKTYYSNEDLLKSDLDFDYYICGSDQIWNTYCKNYDDAFILSFARDKGKRISYAASMGASDISDELKDKFRYELKDFNAISVRENNAVDIIKRLSDKNVVQVADPVFLLDAGQWREIASPRIINKPYIFFYFVHGDIPGMRNYVQQLSKITGMPVAVVNMNLREMKYSNIKCYDAGPSEFLSLIDNAEYVCTNSFHACAFSIIFKKKFIVFTESSGGKAATSSRIYSILSTFGLESRCADKNSSPDDIIKDIDYNYVYKKVDSLIKKSKKFLFDALEINGE